MRRERWSFDHGLLQLHKCTLELRVPLAGVHSPFANSPLFHPGEVSLIDAVALLEVIGIVDLLVVDRSTCW